MPGITLNGWSSVTHRSTRIRVPVRRLLEVLMAVRSLPGRLGEVEFDGELPVRRDLGRVFDELDYQMACQTYLWALPLVSYAQWKTQHYEVFGATSSDLVLYVSYRDRLGLITAIGNTACI